MKGSRAASLRLIKQIVLAESVRGATRPWIDCSYLMLVANSPGSRAGNARL